MHGDGYVFMCACAHRAHTREGSGGSSEFIPRERRQKHGMSWVGRDEEIENDSITGHARMGGREREREGERGRERRCGRVGVTLGRRNSVT